MTTPSLEFHDSAAAEYEAAFDWYLDRSPEAAHNFDAEVERGLTQIVEAPQRWSPGAFNSRRISAEALSIHFDLPGAKIRKLTDRCCRAH